MQEIFERLIEKLKESSFERYGNNGMGGELVVNYDDAIEIVKQAAAEYNNEWIPVSERLPEAGQEVYVTFTNKSAGKTYTELTKFNGEYFNSLNTELYPHITVDAWFPLPPKYQPNGE